MMVTTDTLREAVLREALAGLMLPSGGQKTLSPWLFYDERGSQLFEQITALPEYYLTRTERAILAERGDEIFLEMTAPVTLVELGAGTAAKTGVLLQAALRFQPGILYQPIDVSASALEEAATHIISSIPGVTVRPRVANYITEPFTLFRPQEHRILALYIGSSIGNFTLAERTAILRNLRQHLEPGDALLLGADLAPDVSGSGRSKAVATLLAAYDDAAGVTAAFNKNILVRLNRQLDADFDLEGFAHRVRWNARESRIEMHLESLVAQTVRIPKDGPAERVHFAPGETIHTENSYKFTDAALTKLLSSAEFSVVRTWHDPGRSFAVTLAEAV
jgi:L-histidine N-alpha-methyltransferase